MQPASPDITHGTSWTSRQDRPLEFITPSWTGLVDEFETFLNDHFPSDSQTPATEQAAGEQPGRVSDAWALPPKGKRSTRAKPDQPAAPKTRPLTREQRRRLHNRAAQQQWRERQKVSKAGQIVLPHSQGLKQSIFDLVILTSVVDHLPAE